MKITKEAAIFSIQNAVKFALKISNNTTIPMSDAFYSWTAIFAVKQDNIEYHVIQNDRKAAILKIEKSEFSRSHSFLTVSEINEFCEIFAESNHS